LPAEENIILPEKIKIGQYKAGNHVKITLLGRNNILRRKQEGTSLILTIPKNLQNAPVGLHAICFKIDSRKS